MNVVCVLRSGGDFSAKWAYYLKRQCAKHLQPHRFVVLTDLPEDFEGEDWIPLTNNWPGWWSKLELFKPGQFKGPTWFFDLDTLIVRDLKLPTPSTLWMLNDFFCNARPASGVMAWTPSAQTEHIYHEFCRDVEGNKRTRHGDGGFIGAHIQLHARLQGLMPGVFGSIKAQKLDAGPKEFSVVCHHGRPRFDKMPPHHWAAKHWRGKSCSIPTST